MTNLETQLREAAATTPDREIAAPLLLDAAEGLKRWRERAEKAERELASRVEPSVDDEREIPMDSRVRHVSRQWEGTVVAIDTKYEIQRTDGSHAFAWHRELERLPENRPAEPR